MSSGAEILATLRERGFVQQISDEQGLTALLGRGPVTYYCGFDPTASSLHVGSMVPLMAMAHLARAGHRPIAVLGGGTSMIGDPSGKTELRQMLTEAVRRLSPCDLVLVEGYKAQPIPKLEIWRPSVQKPLLHPRDAAIRGIATDDPSALGSVPLTVFRLDALDEIATFILSNAQNITVSD